MATMKITAEHQSRVEFEAWARRACYEVERHESGQYARNTTEQVWQAWQAARALPAPENVREGEPYDNPAFEDLARTMGVWGTAQAALCAQFFLAGRGAVPDEVDNCQDSDIEWRPVLRHEEDYEVSNKGDLRNKKTGLIQAKNRMGAGYVKADLHRGGTRTQTSVHRLVAQAFLRPGRHGEQVNHINGVKTDNRVENLEWVSKSENEMHSRYHLGNLCKPVIATCLETGESLEFASMDMAAKHTRVYRSGVGKCVRGELRSAKGWTFQLKGKEPEESFTAAQVQAMGRVPPGWQVVPVERTEEMKRAAMELLLDGLDIYVNGQDQIVIETDAPRRLWKAFLAAAPRPPSAQKGQ